MHSSSYTNLINDDEDSKFIVQAETARQSYVHITTSSTSSWKQSKPAVVAAAAAGGSFGLHGQHTKRAAQLLQQHHHKLGSGPRQTYYQPLQQPTSKSAVVEAENKIAKPCRFAKHFLFINRH